MVLASFVRCRRGQAAKHWARQNQVSQISHATAGLAKPSWHTAKRRARQNPASKHSRILGSALPGRGQAAGHWAQKSHA
jgi:hypothetical protein